MEFLDASEQARVAREAELESQRQRELQQAQLLAESEQKRADDQATANKWLRILSGVLFVSFVAVAVLAIYAWAMQNRAVFAQRNAEKALNQALNATDAMVKLFYDPFENLINVPIGQINQQLPSVEEAVIRMGQEPGNIAAHPKFLNTRASLLNLFSDLYARQGEFGTALEQAKEAIKIMEEAEPVMKQFPDESPQKEEWLDNLAESYNRISQYGEYLHSPDELQEAVEKAIDSSRRLAQTSPRLEWQRDLVVNHINLSFQHLSMGNKNDAKSVIDAMREEAKLLESSNAPEDQNVLALSYGSLAYVYDQLGEGENVSDGKNALEFYESSLAILKELVHLNLENAEHIEVNPQNVGHIEDLAFVYELYGRSLLVRDKDLALSQFNYGLKLMKELVQWDPANALWQSQLAYLHLAVGEALEALGKAGEAIQIYNESRNIWEGLISRADSNVSASMGLLHTQNQLVSVWQKQGEYDDALREALHGEEALEPVLSRLGSGVHVVLRKPIPGSRDIEETYYDKGGRRPEDPTVAPRSTAE
jgi:tetratricopeptide (TPR) repeat protein